MRRHASIVLPVVVFLTGLGIGAWFSVGRKAAAFSTGVDARLTANFSATTAATASPEQRAFSSEEEMLATIMSAVSEREPLLRAHRLHEALAKLGSAELSALFEKTVKIEDRERRKLLLDVLLRRWAIVDPAAAKIAVQPFLDRVRKPTPSGSRELDAAINKAWAEVFPGQMLADALAAPNAGWARETASAAIASLAEGDHARQLELLARLPASRLRSEMCEKVMVALAQKDSEAAEAHLDLLTEPRQRARVQAVILGQLGERDPAAGLARLAALAPDFKGGKDDLMLATFVLSEAARKDPAAAIAAVDGLPETLRPQALSAALVGWAQKEPVAALAWGVANGVDLNDARIYVFNGGDFGGAWRPLSMVAFEHDRAGTLDWLRAQPASTERDAMLRNGMWSGGFDEKLQIYAELTPPGQAAAAGEFVEWSTRNGDFSQSEPWVKSLPAGEARQAAIRALASSQTSTAPDHIDMIADDWPAGPDRDAALRGVASSLYNDPPRALGFARRVSDPAARESTFDRIARQWISRDKTAALAWIASAPELSADQRRALLRRADEQ